MLLAAIAITLLGANEVSVAVRPGVVCVEQTRLVSRLQSAGLHVVDGTSRRLAVTIQFEQKQVMVRATRQGAPFERAVPVSGEVCAAVERVVIALISSWSQQLPSADLVEPKSPRPIAVRAAVTPVVSPEAVVDATPAVQAEEEPPPSPPAPAPSAPVLLEAAVPVAQPPEPDRPAVSLALGALGGAGLGPTATVSGVGQLQVGLSLGRFGALLEGGLETARSAQLLPARIELSTQWLSLSGRVQFVPTDRWRLDLALGFRLWRIVAQTFDISNADSLQLLGLGGVASGGVSFQLFGPLSVQLRAFFSLRSQTERFLIEGLGPITELSPWEGGLLLGVEFVKLWPGPRTLDGE